MRNCVPSGGVTLRLTTPALGAGYHAHSLRKEGALDILLALTQSPNYLKPLRPLNLVFHAQLLKRLRGSESPFVATLRSEPPENPYMVMPMIRRTLWRSLLPIQQPRAGSDLLRGRVFYCLSTYGLQNVHRKYLPPCVKHVSV